MKADIMISERLRGSLNGSQVTVISPSFIRYVSTTGFIHPLPSVIETFQTRQKVLPNKIQATDSTENRQNYVSSITLIKICRETHFAPTSVFSLDIESQKSGTSYSKSLADKQTNPEKSTTFTLCYNPLDSNVLYRFSNNTS